MPTDITPHAAEIPWGRAPEINRLISGTVDDQMVEATLDALAYRELAQAAMHHIHTLTVQLARARHTIRHLRSQVRKEAA